MMPWPRWRRRIAIYTIKLNLGGLFSRPRASDSFSGIGASGPYLQLHSSVPLWHLTPSWRLRGAHGW
jgi:hypothetical protein